jgi:hypothetical protein
MVDPVVVNIAVVLRAQHVNPASVVTVLCVEWSIDDCVSACVHTAGLYYASWVARDAEAAKAVELEATMKQTAFVCSREPC